MRAVSTSLCTLIASRKIGGVALVGVAVVLCVLDDGSRIHPRASSGRPRPTRR
ncbi:hypothetical protein B0H12DRAFT_1155007 [Mycena haematopus]|nr:hypothetical protein B0H12DRAFT_1155007 [Mycena haematopus]